MGGGCTTIILFLSTLALVASAAPRAHAQTPAPKTAKAAKPAKSLAAEQKLLTLDDLYGGASGRPLYVWGNLPAITGWLPDGAHYMEYAYPGTGEPQLMRVDARTGMSEPLYDAARMEAALTGLPGIDMRGAHDAAYQENYTFDASHSRALISYRNNLYLYEFASGKAFSLTAVEAKSRVENESFSPDGKRVAFIRNGDLYSVDIAAPGVEHRLTKDGGPQISNGHLDWVYEEELYGRGKTDGYAWSPDSSRIAFLHLDEQNVKPFPIVNDMSAIPDTERQWYPKSGDPNPIVGLGVVDADGKVSPRFLDVTRYGDDDRLIVRFCWTPDSTQVVFQVQNRIQTFLDLNVADAIHGGEAKTLFREATTAWVDVIDNPIFLADGSFLWQSERTGHRHLYRGRLDKPQLAAITQGNWDIKDFYGVDPDGKFAYFSASEHSPIATDAYRVALTGGALPVKPVRLTSAHEGSHQTRFDPTFHLFLDEWSEVMTPPHLRLAGTEGSGETVRDIADSAETARTVAPYKMGKAEFVHLNARDGFPLEALLIRPPDFDPTKKYPVFCPVYGGPGISTVRNEWQNRDWLLWQFLAQKGYVVWAFDNRSGSGKGAASQWPIFHKFGETELRDTEDGLDYLKKQPWVDASRIGISGWSFGGFMAEYALTHSKSFKIGISGAGVSDWRLYDTIYTERYMGTPEQNPEGYRSSAPVNAANEGSGKLLLLHGMMDDNVHLQNTVQLSYALQKAGRPFDMMLYPGRRARHGISDPQQDRHLNLLIAHFILENL